MKKSKNKLPTTADLIRPVRSALALALPALLLAPRAPPVQMGRGCVIL